MMNILAGILAGVSTAVPVASGAEWFLHKYGLHMPKEKRVGKPIYIVNMAIAHHDEHHKAYKGPAHYYRDTTNAHAVSEFSADDHRRIRNYSIASGIAVALGVSVPDARPAILGSAALAAAFAATAILYDNAYEFTHHYMHDIGERRLHIGRALGNFIQGMPDGKLRNSKPLVDDISTAIDNYVDLPAKKRPQRFVFSSDITDKLRYQMAVNRERGRARIEMQPGTEATVLDAVTREVILEEPQREAAWQGKHAYNRERAIQQFLRNSHYFQFIDNHHFMHHFKQNKNFNVVFPLADILLGTYISSSRKTLEENQQYWICINSPDTEPFKLIPRATHVTAV